MQGHRLSVPDASAAAAIALCSARPWTCVSGDQAAISGDQAVANSDALRVSLSAAGGRGLPTNLCPLPSQRAPSATNAPPQRHAVLRGYHGDPALMRRHHPRSVAYIRAHS